jgi:hypothetical protein
MRLVQAIHDRVIWREQMGASSWSYFVPYQSDIEKALQDLRQSVFTEGDYYKPDAFAQENLALVKRQYEEGRITKEELEGLVHQVEAEAEPAPETIEELLEQRAEEMTHSIIDIQRVSDEPGDYFTVTPLSPKEHEEVLGTVRPTRALLERDETQSALFRLRGRGSGVYVIAYKNDQPDEICFVGVTGD